ncbi:MAG: hypothetical protein QM791_03445 [Ferruginibacter sp.]
MEINEVFYEALFNRPFSSQDADEFLAGITKEHPYFSPAQFYYLRNLSKHNPAFNDQLSRTGALFNNNYWLNFLLIESADGMKDEEEEMTLEQAPAFPATEEQQEVYYENTVEEEPETQNYNETVIAENIATGHGQENEKETENTDFAYGNDGGSVSPNGEAGIVISEEQPEEIIENTEALTAAASEDNDEAGSSYGNVVTHTEEEITEEAAILLNEIKNETPEAPVVEEPELTPAEAVSNTIGHAEEEITEEIISSPDDKKEEFTETAVMEMPDPVEEVRMPEVPEPAEEVINKEEEAALQLLTSLSNIAAAAETKEDVLIFEPLHTTDYFASVGIKLSEEVKPSDKLGKQLKSFTEWLKTMKKVHTAPQLDTTQEAEQKIQVLAEKSNVNGDVVTESMADVLAQQGRTDQAIEMLEKLSLLNPAKSAYFAAKIKNFKEQ